MSESNKYNNQPQPIDHNSYDEKSTNDNDIDSMKSEFLRVDIDDQERTRLAEIITLAARPDLVESDESPENPIKSPEAKFFLAKIYSLTTASELRGLITPIALATNLKESNLKPSEAVVLIDIINSKTAKRL